MSTAMAMEARIERILAGHGVDLVITVPCKYFARLLVSLEEDARFDVVLPCREEEGAGIAAGAYLGGRRPLMLIQNSGLGNMINAVRSLHGFYGIPLCLLISYRGDESEAVPAQRPMGLVTEELLAVMDVECVPLDSPDQLDRLDEGLQRYADERRSVAFLARRAFWSP